MCTLIVLHRCVPGKPLVAAANRDEFLDRPAEGLALRSSKTGPIVTPLDLEAGGTWVGVNAWGVFAGLTNLRPGAIESLEPTLARPDRSVESELRSRGEVVMMALEAESAADAIHPLSKLEKGKYNPFQLLIADGDEAWLLVYRESGRAIRLEPGLHVVGNVVDERIEAELAATSDSRVASELASKLDREQKPRARKLARIRAHVEKLMTEPDRDYFEGLARICREHVDEIGAITDACVERIEGVEGKGGQEGREAISPFEATCVHVENRYGTRSSLLLELSTDPASNRLWATDGPPCERPYENRSFLLRELGVRLGDRAGAEPS